MEWVLFLSNSFVEYVSRIRYKAEQIMSKETASFGDSSLRISSCIGDEDSYLIDFV